jgi:hypothetical protein
MNNHTTYEQIIQRFEENGLQSCTLPLNDALKILVSQRGGRILGPFAGRRLESILWMNESFSDKEAFKEFLKAGDWNLGGDRVWIAPELQYNVKNREDFFGSYALPQQVDPGSYSMEQPSVNSCLLEQDMVLEVYGAEGQTKKLSIRRLVSEASDPLRELEDYEELISDATYCGIDHRLRLSEKENDGYYSETWDLAQVNPGGNLYISTLPGAKHTDYYLPIDDSYQTMGENYVRLKIDGTRQYKVGYKASYFLGRVGYHNSFEKGTEYFLVRNFFSNPSAVYTKEPPEKHGCKGHPIHIYNDDESYGGFAEIECSGQAIGGDTGKSSREDQMVTWLYLGKPARIEKIARTLMGVDLSRLA